MGAMRECADKPFLVPVDDDEAKGFYVCTLEIRYGSGTATREPGNTHSKPV